jgi:hypothetical protein
MSSLGHFFPESDRMDHIRRQVLPGVVLYLFRSFTKPKKEKYLVLVCGGSVPYLFVINSQIHKFIEDRPHLYELQVRIRESDYDFLDHDSYVDCSRVRIEMSNRDINDQLTSDVSRIKGHLIDRDRTRIAEAVARATTLSRVEKDRILQALTPH